MNSDNTTYFVNGNSSDIEKIMDGVLTAPRNERFIIVTNEKIPDKNRRIVTELCEKSDMIEERVVKHSKNCFSQFVKSDCHNFIKEPTDQIVVMPQITVSGPKFVEAVENGAVTIRGRYMEKTIVRKNSIDENDLPDVSPGGTMHILIDYENVYNEGLIGSEYLNQDDKVTIFYSDPNTTIQQGHFDNLTKKAGSFDMVKLKQVRHNGLDFYIATRVGQLLETNPGEKILIISKDQGYMAVMDYCETYAGLKDEIQLAESIEAGLIVLDGETERREQILNSRSVRKLETEYSLYKERNALYEQVKELLSGTPYMGDIDQIFGIMEYSPTQKEKYTATLHAFGIKRGQEIYRLMKLVEVA